MENSFTKVGIISGLFRKVSKNAFYLFHEMNMGYHNRWKHKKIINHNIQVIQKFSWFRGWEKIPLFFRY